MTQSCRFRACFWLLLGWMLAAFSLTAQAPFSRKISSPLGLIKATHLQQAPNGDLLLAAEMPGNDPNIRTSGFIRLNANGGFIQARRMLITGNLFGSVLDARELPDGNLLLLLFMDNGGATVNGQCYLQKYTPTMQLIWSTAVSPVAGYSESRRVQVQLGPAGSFYVYWEGGQLSSTPYANILSKISDAGQVLWSQGTDTPIKSMVSAPNGDILLGSQGDLNAQHNDCSIARLNTDGQLIQTLLLPSGEFQYGVDVYPGGDYLVNWQRNDGHYFIRFSSNLNLLKSWRLPRLFGNLEYNQLAIASDSLVFVFASSFAFGQSGSICMRMDGDGNIEKSVFLSRYMEGGFKSVAPIPINGKGFARPMKHDFFANDQIVLQMDTALVLNTCPQPTYDCEQTAPVTIQTQPGLLEFHPYQIPTAQKNISWELFTPVVLPFCYLYVAPTAEFSLPDTICAGEEIRPDTLRNNNAGSQKWVLTHQGVSDSLLVAQPVFVFTELGEWTIRQSITYLDCKTDTFERTLIVLPKPVVALGADTSLCTEESLLITAQVQQALSWQWENQQTGLERLVTESGLYVFTAGSGACTASDSIQVIFNAASADFEAPEDLCVGEVLELNAANTLPQLNHFWELTPGFQGLTGAAISVQVPNPGSYTIQHITENAGCRDTVVALLQVSEMPFVQLPPDANLCTDTLVLALPDTVNVSSWFWMDQWQEFSRQIEQAGTYIFTGINGVCQVADTMEVLLSGCDETPCFLPNVFAPEMSGINARYQIFCNFNVEQVLLMEIYDRWGSLLFRSQTGADWDGQFRGQACAPGVYVCHARVRLRDGTEKDYYQDLTLLR
jgi:gliding motility-associated-like protein